MKEKTFLKLFTNYLAVLCFAIFLAPGFAVAAVEDPTPVFQPIPHDARVSMGSDANGELKGYSTQGNSLAAETISVVKAAFPNANLVYSKTVGASLNPVGSSGPPHTTEDGLAPFDFKFKLPAGHSAAGQPAKDVLVAIATKKATAADAPFADHVKLFDSATGTASPTAGQWQLYNADGTEALGTSDKLAEGREYIMRLMVKNSALAWPSSLDQDAEAESISLDAAILFNKEVAPTEGSGAQYVADPQVDAEAKLVPIANLKAETALAAGTDVGPLEYGYVNNVRSTDADAKTKSIVLETDAGAAGVDPAAKFVTYFVPFTVPNYADASLNLEDLNPTVNDVKVENKGTDAVEFKLVNTVTDVTDGGFYWVALDGGAIVLEDAELEDGKTYNVFYTVKIDTGKASSNVAVLTKTGAVEIQAKPSQPNIPAKNGKFGQAGTAVDLETITVAPGGGLHTVNIDTASSPYEKPYENANITYVGTDVFGSAAGPLQEFAYSGFNDGDIMLFTRQFVYNVDVVGEVGQPVAKVTADTLRLQKWESGHKIGDFTLVNTPPTAPTATELPGMDGQFWATYTLGTTVDANVNINDDYVPGATYTIYFVVKDDGDFDLVKDPNAAAGQNVIADPNGLYAQARPSGNSSSSGCSVGDTNAYDMALLALFGLGLVALRVRTRKS